MLPENRKRCYFTTARVIHKEGTEDWLWINSREIAQFKTTDGAQSIADLANANGRDSGLDIDNYPYFVVKVTQTSNIQEVKL